MHKRLLNVQGGIVMVVVLLASLALASAATGKNSIPPAATAVFTTNVVQGQPDQPLVRLEVPLSATVGETITVRLLADNVTNLAGFQAAIIYEKGRIGFLRASAGAGMAANSGTIFPMGPVWRTSAVVFGAATCPTADCDAPAGQSAVQTIDGVSGTAVELATFSFIVKEAGPQTLTLDEIMLVDMEGRPLLATTPALQAAQSRTPTLDELDVSQSRFVNAADATIIMTEWADLQKDGACMADYAAVYDVDGSGCLTVADVQMVLAHWGQFIDVEPPDLTIDGVTAVHSTFTVNDNGNAADLIVGDGLCLTSSGRCTLRAALQEANFSPGTDTINFDIRNIGGGCPSLVTITPTSSLTLESDGITIDGYTQCNASPNTNQINGNAAIKIQIQGNGSSIGVYGLQILSDNNLIRGLAIYNWHQQIRVATGDNNHIEGNFLGTNAANTFTANFPGAEGDGIRIAFGDNNVIGGASPGQRNIVSGNDQDGINVESNSHDNLVIGNYVGLKQDGATPLRNVADGIDVAEGAYSNRIGGLAPGERNVIGGNFRDGIEISHGSANQNNIFVGNFIGLNAAGTAAVGNGHMGVTFEDEINQNQVYRNVIVGNGANGVRLYAAYNNEVYDNFIGVYPAGLSWSNPVPLPSTVSEANLVALPNGTDPAVNKGISGVYITAGSQGNQVYRNIIAFHPEYGIYVQVETPYPDIASFIPCGVYHNTFSRNRIYNNDSLGIRLKSGTCSGNTYHPNEQIPYPVITQPYTTQVSGTACANCIIELFLADKTVVDNPAGDNHGEGKTFIASGTANASGNFSIAVSGLGLNQIITATATDLAGNTSEFARNVKVIQAPPPPTHTPTPTATPTATPPVLDEHVYLPITLKGQ